MGMAYSVTVYPKSHNLNKDSLLQVRLGCATGYKRGLVLWLGQARGRALRLGQASGPCTAAIKSAERTFCERKHFLAGNVLWQEKCCGRKRFVVGNVL